jgi:hypothetical protein
MPTVSGLPWCDVTASYNAQYDVSVEVSVASNQPNQNVMAITSDGESEDYSTDASGYADFYVYAYADEGNLTITVRVGGASCFATA